MNSRLRVTLDDFFDPPADGAEIAVLRAVRSLHDANASERARSHGRVRRPETFYSHGVAAPKGVLSERIFGPVRSFHCRCGRYRGEDRSAPVCDNCGVPVASNELRSWRWGHVEVPPLLHPVCTRAVADLLGMSTEEVWSVARGEAELRDGIVEAGFDLEFERTGTSALRDAVRAVPTTSWHTRLEEHGLEVDDLFITSVPVPPPGDRELDIPEDDPRSTFPSQGTVNAALLDLVAQSLRTRRFDELKAPDILRVLEYRRMQEAFEHALEEVARGNRLDLWERLPDAPAIPIHRSGLEEHEEAAALSGAVSALLYLDDHILLEQRGSRLRLFDTRDGTVDRTLDVPAIPMRSVHDGLILFGHHLWLSDEPDITVSGIAVLDLETGDLLSEVPEGIPLHSVQNEQPEELYLIDARHGRGIDFSNELPGDRPSLGAFTRDGCYALIYGHPDSGRLLELHTGLTLHDLDDLVLGEEAVYLNVDGTTAEGQAYDHQGVSVSSAARKSATGWQWLTEAGTIGEDEELLYRLNFSCNAAAFSPDGTILAVALEGSDEILLLDAHRPEVSSRLR